MQQKKKQGSEEWAGGKAVTKIARKCPHNRETARQYLREYLDLLLSLLELDQKSRRFCSLPLDTGNVIRIQKYYFSSTRPLLLYYLISII